MPTKISYFFFFNDTATTEIYTLSLHDALPIWVEDLAAFPDVLALGLLGAANDLQPLERLALAVVRTLGAGGGRIGAFAQDLLDAARDHAVVLGHADLGLGLAALDRKSTRLNSSHLV